MVDEQAAKIALKTAFCPDIWRPYAEMEAIDKKKAKISPLEEVMVEHTVN